VRADSVASIEEDDVAVLGRGDSFGELAVLYHLRREATFRAREDCVIFAISRAEFMRWCQHHHRKITDYVKVLDEVHALQSLLSSERYELACHVHSVVDFKPGERILHQNKERKANQWYVVSGGGAEQYMLREGPDGTQEKVWLADLRRGSHFGERSLMRGDTSSQSNVDTNVGGMTCLVFEYAVVAEILEKVFRSPGGELPRPEDPIQEWCQRLAEGWNNHHTGSIGVNKRGQTVRFENLRKKCGLGRGGFCKVTLVEDVSDGKRYALKTMSKGYLSQSGAERQIRWERELLSIVDSPFIINLHKTFIDSQHIFFSAGGRAGRKPGRRTGRQPGGLPGGPAEGFRGGLLRRLPGAGPGAPAHAFHCAPRRQDGERAARRARLCKVVRHGLRALRAG
jgi:CRP-like cAMP-binding protein